MEGDKEHWDEIVQIVKTANSKNQTPLDTRRDEELRSGVYSHIDTMYPSASAMEASPALDSSKGSIGNRLLEHLQGIFCLLYTSPSPRDRTRSRMPSSA